MKAARLYEYGQPLRLEEQPVPEPQADEVLVRVAGAGVCRSDLYVIDGELSEYVALPVTMGHEIAGWVERAGPRARAPQRDTAVAVMVGWGCGSCSWCISGHEQICPNGREAGSTADGGFADYVLVPTARHLVPLGKLDPVRAAPLGDAGISSYAAVMRVRPYLPGGSTVVVIGVGGLGQMAVQIAREMTGARIIAVDRRRDQLDRAADLGAAQTILVADDTAAELRAATDGEGAHAVLDFVGTDESLALATQAVRQRGIIALLGLAGGHVPFGFYSQAPEAVLTTVFAGTRSDLDGVVALAREGRIETLVTTYPLDDVNRALDDLRAGRIDGRAVMTP
jgi:propanol-preferring alcohol dehydrogenase